MCKNKITRRDFLKLAGATSAGLALSACGVQATELPTSTVTITPTPRATLPPSPTPRPQVKILELTRIYAGPRNVGYEPIVSLSKGDLVTPVATFGEFVKLESKVDDKLYEGFVEKSLLDTLPSDLRTMPISEVPWLQKIAVPSEFPLSFASESPNYQGSGIYGTTLIPDSDFQVEIDLSVDFGNQSPKDCSTGIWLIDDKSRRIVLAYQRGGGWGVCYYIGETPVFCQQLPISREQSGDFILSLSKHNSILNVTFPNGQNKNFDLGEEVYFSSDTIRVIPQIAPFSTLDINYLSLSQLPSGLPETNPALTESLGGLAKKHGLTFGTETDDGEKSNLGEQVLTAQANLLVWSLNWRMETEQEGFDFFQFPPSYLSFAKAHNMRIRAHTLIGGPGDIVPTWLKNGNFTKKDIENFTKERIQSMMTTFKSVDEWVVVNEALGEGTALDNNIWQRTFGKQYIDMAFRFAREANANAALIFNEAEIDRPGARTKFVYNMLQEFIDQGMPIDGVGMQFHLKAVNSPSKDEMLEAIQLLGSLGLGVYITELDVNLFGLRGSKEEKWAKQAEIYRDVVEAALESGVCKSITTWGLSDKYSWLLLPEFQILGGGEAPLLFDDDFNPKPAYFAVRDVLQEKQ